jgi:beta-glucosidase
LVIQEKFEKFKSNYIDERNEPLFPFGFGLSYTHYSIIQILKLHDEISASVDVTNTMNYKEIVQLYTRDLVGSDPEKS